jgi:hypothetical protein
VVAGLTLFGGDFAERTILNDSPVFESNSRLGRDAGFQPPVKGPFSLVTERPIASIRRDLEIRSVQIGDGASGR